MPPTKLFNPFTTNSTLKARKRQVFFHKIRKFFLYLGPIAILILIFIFKNSISHLLIQGQKTNEKSSPNQEKYLYVNLFFSKIYPNISPDSSSSASYNNPIKELEKFVSSQSGQLSQISTDGDILQSSISANISFIANSKPDKQYLKSIFDVFEEISFYLQFDQAYVYKNSIFLRPTEYPDMIISVTMPKGEVSERLRYLSELIKAKKDPQLIDLRFRHPLVY